MTLTHAILASLVERSCSGYDLAKQFTGSVGYFWAASHQQIYRELSKLEAQGEITSQTINQAGKPDKKLYQITEQGKEQLSLWIAQPCEPAPIKDDLLVKIFAGYIVSPSTILTELEHHRQAHLEKLSAYKALQQQYFPDPLELASPEKFQYLTLLNGIHYETAWLAWCEEAIALLS